MAPQAFQNIIIAGASGTIGTPITSLLLTHPSFNISVLTRPTSTAAFPVGVTIKRADLSSHVDLVEAFRGQDVVICALNDEATSLQEGIVTAAYEAGVKRFLPNEWANHDMCLTGTPLEEVREGKRAMVEVLDGLVKRGKEEGKEFHWTGVNNGVFVDWALLVGFIDITLPPSRTARIWDTGDNVTTCTTLSTVAKAVLAVLTTAEETTRDRLVNIQSFAVSPNDIVVALEKVAAKKWAVEKTTTEKELVFANEALEKGDFLSAYYAWMKACIFAKGSTLENVENELLGLEGEDLESVVGKIVRGETV